MRSSVACECVCASMFVNEDCYRNRLKFISLSKVIFWIIYIM